MANLLPNKTIEIAQKVFSINGISTEGTPNRQKILQLWNQRSAAIEFNKIIPLDVEKGREYIKTIDTLYIYHDKIDSKGEGQRTERAVFDAVDEAFNDLNLLIRKLNSWNVSRILITADHGFLLSMKDIPDTMREDVPAVQNDFIIDKRFVIGEAVRGASYELPITATTNINSPLRIGLPKSVNRYRSPGGGVQYVHGGASLQELLVPVVEYNRLREDTAEKVKVRLLKFDERISSGYMRASVLQFEPVGDGVKELEAIVGLYSDNDELVSSEARISFNSTSTSPQERMFEVTLTLSSKGTTLNHCLLKGFDVDDHMRLNPLFNQRILIQSLIQRDF